MKKYLKIIVVAFVFSACGAPKVLVSHKQNAEIAASHGNFTQAVEEWKQYFTQTSIEETEGAEFAKAAKTAFKAGENDLAINWFDQARYKDYSDFEMYSALAKIYQSKSNISKELNALEYINENFSDNSSKIDNRLFNVYFEIILPQKALQVWDRLDNNSKNDLINLSNYLSIQMDLKSNEICDSVSLVLLEKNPEHIEALEWNAKKFYWLGENRYQSELTKYEKNKTNKQYRILLKELDLATADLKKSLIYLEKLWKIEQGKEYASYFASIYARFGDEKKSKSYQKYMK